MLAFNSEKQSGFSLIEVLIAITLLAFITLGVVNITQDAFRNKERTTEFNSNTLLIEAAMSRFEWDITQIYSPLYFSTAMNLATNAVPNDGMQPFDVEPNDPTQPPAVKPQPVNPALQAYYEQILSRFERNERFITISKEGQPIPRFYSPEKTTFEFFTSSNRRKLENTPQSHFAWVRYTLDNQEAPKDDEKIHAEMPATVKSLVRYFSADDPYDDKRMEADSDLIKGAVLLENVESLEFQFWDYQRKKWENNLLVIPEGDKIIRGVRILITYWDSAGQHKAERTFRPHWPMVIPTDAPKQPATPATPSDPAEDDPGVDQ